MACHETLVDPASLEVIASSTGPSSSITKEQNALCRIVPLERPISLDDRLTRLIDQAHSPKICIVQSQP